jgi:sarcosine oxidase gamma subunit
MGRNPTVAVAAKLAQNQRMAGYNPLQQPIRPLVQPNIARRRRSSPCRPHIRPRESIQRRITAGINARFAYRGMSSALDEAFGFALPNQPCRGAAQRDRAALWLGPDEWLLIAPAVEAVCFCSRLRALWPVDPRVSST